MTPDLVAILLAAPLPVRLALLDAEPTGAGWYVDMDPYMQDPALHVSAESAGLRFLRARIERGDAWLPCNPLAIVEHARVSARATTAGINMSFGGSTYAWIRHAGGREQEFRGLSVYECAVALLREVVGG